MIVTNTTYQLCLWADALYAMDTAWWKRYLPDVLTRFRGERVTCNQNVGGVHHERGMPQSSNSGEGAISLAAHRGARRIILLGYDCQHTWGRRHHHGDHPRGLGNASSVGNWPKHFDALALRLAGVEILNATRETALKIWPTKSLEEALQ